MIIEGCSRDLLRVFPDIFPDFFGLVRGGPPVFFQHPRIVFEHFGKKWSGVGGGGVVLTSAF